LWPPHFRGGGHKLGYGPSGSKEALSANQSFSPYTDKAMTKAQYLKKTEALEARRIKSLKALQEAYKDGGLAIGAEATDCHGTTIIIDKKWIDFAYFSGVCIAYEGIDKKHGWRSTIISPNIEGHPK